MLWRELLYICGTKYEYSAFRTTKKISKMANGFKLEGGFLPHLVYSVVLPLFFLGSVLLYNPFDIEGFYTFGTFSFGFHLTIISCIILLCSILGRLSLFFVLRELDMNWTQYGIWCFGEMLIMSAFVALYTVLFKGSDGGYFAVLPNCVKFIFLILIYPYGFLTLTQVIRLKDEELERRLQPGDNSLIRFHDEHKRLKLSIAPSAILFVRSDYNYVKINYLDAGKVKEFTLRASMKSLDDIGSRCLVRCQRSYFVNPEHISVLRKDPQGMIFAEMNIPGVSAVPVSKQYYDSLSSLL